MTFQKPQDGAARRPSRSFTGARSTTGFRASSGSRANVGSRSDSAGRSASADRAPSARSSERSFSDRSAAPARSSAPARSFDRSSDRSSGYSSDRSFGRSSAPARSSSGGYAPRFGGGASFGRGRSFSKPRHRSDFIDEAMFINKAVMSEVEEHVATHTFADFNVHELLGKNLAAKGFVQPSPIQDQSIPVSLEGKDVIGIASTGTGKTAAFLIPIINKIMDDRKHQAMILTPTRELAQQIEVEFRALTQGMRLYSVCVVGGLPIMKQIREIDMGVHIVIGTPGRVKDLIARGKINMSTFGTIVLDEADRMLDMGFVDDMRTILGGMPEDRQGLFFSATFSPEIKHLCKDFLKDPVTISIKSRDTSSSVEQDVVRVGRGDQKIDILHDILTKPELKKVLIFRETKRHTDELAQELRSRGFSVSALHGDMRSRERSRAVEALAKGSIQAVIATDVAARGIDIPDVTHVINYDTPSTYDTYVHRIGRTGRGNKKGTALTFVRG